MKRNCIVREECPKCGSEWFHFEGCPHRHRPYSPVLKNQTATVRYVRYDEACEETSRAERAARELAKALREIVYVWGAGKARGYRDEPWTVAVEALNAHREYDPAWTNTEPNG